MLFTECRLQSFVYEVSFTELRLQKCVYRIVLSELCLQTFFDRPSLTEFCSQSSVYTAVFTELCAQSFLYGALFTELCHAIGTQISINHTRSTEYHPEWHRLAVTRVNTEFLSRWRSSRCVLSVICIPFLNSSSKNPYRQSLVLALRTVDSDHLLFSHLGVSPVWKLRVVASDDSL